MFIQPKIDRVMDELTILLTSAGTLELEANAPAKPIA